MLVERNNVGHVRMSVRFRKVYEYRLSHDAKSYDGSRTSSGFRRNSLLALLGNFPVFLASFLILARDLHVPI